MSTLFSEKIGSVGDQHERTDGLHSQLLGLRPFAESMFSFHVSEVKSFDKPQICHHGQLKSVFSKKE
jgi:hypothetical protein